MNNNTLINLEMQVINEQDWPERSLSYLCRRFDQLEKERDYTECKPAIHIGFLDFAPFSEYSEFYATYKLLNINNYHLYSDKFILGVVDLTHIELATDEDKAYGIDHWAKLFKATTWEEIKMIAKNDRILTEASESLYILNADEMEKARCRAREEFILHQNAINRKIARLTEENEILHSEKDALSSENEALSSENERLRAELAKYKSSEGIILWATRMSAKTMITIVSGNIGRKHPKTGSDTNGACFILYLREKRFF